MIPQHKSRLEIFFFMTMQYAKQLIKLSEVFEKNSIALWYDSKKMSFNTKNFIFSVLEEF